MASTAPSAPLSQHVIRPTWVVALVFAVYVTFRLVTGSTVENALSQVPVDATSGETTDARAGYDGQFTYYIAADPLHASSRLDVPSYRMQRILLPLLGFVFSFGQTRLVPWALLAMNTLALLGGVWLLEQIMQSARASRWLALIYGLSPGIFLAAALSLTEPLSYGLVIAAIYLDREEKPITSAVAFALAALAKETALIFVAGSLLWMALRRRWRDLLRLGLIAGLPFTIWQFVLALWLGSPGIGSGGAGSTPFEIIPYHGYIRSVRLYFVADPYAAGDRFAMGYALVAFLIAVLPSLWGLVRGVLDFLRARNSEASGYLLANAATIPILPLSTIGQIGGLLRFIPGLTLAFLLYGVSARERWMLNYSWVWLASAAFVFLA